MRRFPVRLTFAFLALASLPACDTWLGESKGAPLKGTRISVLQHAKSIEPDSGLAGVEILLPRPEDSVEWPQSGGYPSHAMHHMVLGDNLRRSWKTGVGTGSSDTRKLMSEPVVAGGRVFVMDAEARVSSFDEKKGSRIWRVNLTPKHDDDDHMGGGLAFNEGYLIATTGFGHVVALDGGNGAELWRVNLNVPMRAPPTIRAGRVFVITADNQTQALDLKTGDKLWNHAGITESASMLGGGAPAADANMVVVPYSSGELVALKIDNGNVLWTESLTTGRRTDAVASLADIRARPIIDRGRVYAIGNAGLMVAIDIRTGRRLWEAEIGSLQSPWVAGNYVFVITNDAELICMDAKSGKAFWVNPLQRWKKESDRSGPITWAGPVLASDRLIVTSSHGWALSISPYTGEVSGKEELPDPVTQTPAVANSTIFFLTTGGDLVAYR
jgi:outer membrane protein assembly factor BamB